MFSSDDGAEEVCDKDREILRVASDCHRQKKKKKKAHEQFSLLLIGSQHASTNTSLIPYTQWTNNENPLQVYENGVLNRHNCDVRL